MAGKFTGRKEAALHSAGRGQAVTHPECRRGTGDQPSRVQVGYRRSPIQNTMGYRQSTIQSASRVLAVSHWCSYGRDNSVETLLAVGRAHLWVCRGTRTPEWGGGFGGTGFHVRNASGRFSPGQACKITRACPGNVARAALHLVASPTLCWPTVLHPEVAGEPLPEKA